MNIAMLLKDLLYVIILAAIPIISKYVVQFINNKSDEIKSHITNQKQLTLLSTITQMITDVTIKTNQTYVDALKAGDGCWNEETMKEAFYRTKKTIMSLLTQDAEDLIKLLYGDVDEWLDTTIEATVNKLKTKV